MGNSCCAPQPPNNHQQRKTLCCAATNNGGHSIRGSPLAIHASSNTGMPPNQANRQTGQLEIPPPKIEIVQTVETRDEEIEPVAAAGDANDTDEKSNIIKSTEITTSPSICNLESDVCKEPRKSISYLVDATEYEDICAVCLDGYDEENPKILTECKHHYHLACTLEWMERSNRCPMCDQVLVMDESSS